MHALAQALAYMHRCQPEMVFVEVSGLSDGPWQNSHLHRVYPLGCLRK